MSTFASVNVDIAEFSDEEIYIRFRHSTNNAVNYAKPVAIDDITVQGATASPVLWINNDAWDAGSIANETFVFSDEFRIRNMGAALLTITSADFNGDYSYYAEHYTVYVSTTTNRLDQFTHVLHDETLKPIHVEW